MKYANLGRTGLKVSRLCLGTMNFGPRTSEQDSHEIMDAALDKGFNFFDTANSYGRPVRAGLTEEIIGKWFSKGEARRDKVVLATKVYASMNDWPNNSRLSALNICKSCEESLRRLKTDYIDLYQMHHIDRDSPWEEIWQAMEQLVQSGKVIYVGSSNFAGWHIAKANEEAKRRNFMGLVSEQSLYNLMERTVELEVNPACREYGLATLPWSPLAGGLLGGAVREHSEGRRAQAIEKIEANREQLEAYESLCDEIGEEPGVVALAWLLNNPDVTSPIIGPRTMEQFEHSLNALDVILTDEILSRLDEIFPGPGGEAPEAYAW